MSIKTVEIQMFPDGRLDSKNAAAFLGFSVKTLAMMRSQGVGPKYIKRGRIFYYIGELEQWIMHGERVSTAQKDLHGTKESR